MPNAPIVLFAYNRPVHLQKTLESLKQNALAQASVLYIFLDGAKSQRDEAAVQAVYDVASQTTGFQQVIVEAQTQNLGLARSVIRGVSSVLTQHKKAVILEDDMICASDFLTFMNEALVKYEALAQVFSISGYSYPIDIPSTYPHEVWVSARASSWGWATWLDRWEQVDWEVKDFDTFIKNPVQRKAFNQHGMDLSWMLVRQQKGQIDSWAIRWTYAHFKHQAYCVFPCLSKIRNIGNDDSGTHSPTTQKYDTGLHAGMPQLLPLPSPDTAILQNLAQFFRSRWFRHYWREIRMSLGLI